MLQKANQKKGGENKNKNEINWKTTPKKKNQRE